MGDVITIIFLFLLCVYLGYKNRTEDETEYKEETNVVPTPEPENKFDRQFYLDHISSDKFKELKLNRLIIDNFECQQCHCKVTAETSHCHHITYKRLGAEKYKDLVSVCPACHDKIHKFHGKNAKYYPLLKL